MLKGCHLRSPFRLGGHSRGYVFLFCSYSWWFFFFRWKVYNLLHSPNSMSGFGPKKIQGWTIHFSCVLCSTRSVSFSRRVHSRSPSKLQLPRPFCSVCCSNPVVVILITCFFSLRVRMFSLYSFYVQNWSFWPVPGNASKYRRFLVGFAFQVFICDIYFWKLNWNNTLFPDCLLF